MATTAARYGMFSGGETVVVGVSGGPDSVCLLDILARLGADLTLHVAHVDHGLSERSEQISGDVARWAAAAGHDVHIARAAGLSGPNLHARARAFRYSFFDAIARDNAADLIATGHTLDDRAETVIQRLVHGAGTTTLAGVVPHDGRRVRPLIEIRRNETRAYCEECGLAFVDDPANEDPRFERSFIRHDILPLIQERWGDGGIRAIARSGERLLEDGSALDELGDRMWAGMVEEAGEGVLRLDLKTLMKLSRALRRRLLERSIPQVRDRAAGIDDVLDALERDDLKVPASFDLPGGVVVRVDACAVEIDATGISNDAEGK